MIKTRLFNNLIALVLILALTAAVLIKLTDVCQLKRSEYTYGEFTSGEVEADVLFFGSSRMINAVFPMKLWKDYGITSYNLGAHANLLPATYWEMENAFTVHKPKLVVVDTYGLSDNFKYETPEYLHSWMDAFPLSMTKMKAILDLNNDSYKDDAIKSGIADDTIKGSTAEYIWNFIKYHSRWDEITDEDYITPSSTEKGAEARIRVESFADKYIFNDDGSFEYVDEPDRDVMIDGEYIGEEYLQKIIDSCKEKNIDILLVYLPSESNENHYAQINRTREIARANNVMFADIFEDVPVDPRTDYYDAKHINPIGASKVTDYMGKLIVDNYNIEDKRDDEQYAISWNEDYEKYAYYMSEVFDRSDEISKAFVQVMFSEFDSVIEIYNPAVFEDETLNCMLEKMNVDTQKAQEICDNDGACIVITSTGCEDASIYSIREVPDECIQMLTDKKSEFDLETEFFVPVENMRISITNQLNGYINVKEF